MHFKCESMTDERLRYIGSLVDEEVTTINDTVALICFALVLPFEHPSFGVGFSE